MKLRNSIYVEASLGEPPKTMSVWLRGLLLAIDMSLVKPGLVTTYNILARDQPATNEQKPNRRCLMNFVPAEGREEEIYSGVCEILNCKIDQVMFGKIEIESDGLAADDILVRGGWTSHKDETSMVTHLCGRYYMRRVEGERQILDTLAVVFNVSFMPDTVAKLLSKGGICGSTVEKMLKKINKLYVERAG